MKVQRGDWIGSEKSSDDLLESGVKAMAVDTAP